MKDKIKIIIICLLLITLLYLVLNNDECECFILGAQRSNIKIMNPLLKVEGDEESEGEGDEESEVEGDEESEVEGDEESEGGLTMNPLISEIKGLRNSLKDVKPTPEESEIVSEVSKLLDNQREDNDIFECPLLEGGKLIKYEENGKPNTNDAHNIVTAEWHKEVDKDSGKTKNYNDQFLNFCILLGSEVEPQKYDEYYKQICQGGSVGRLGQVWEKLQKTGKDFFACDTGLIGMAGGIGKTGRIIYEEVVPNNIFEKYNGINTFYCAGSISPISYGGNGLVSKSMWNLIKNKYEPGWIQQIVNQIKIELINNFDFCINTDDPFNQFNLNEGKDLFQLITDYGCDATGVIKGSKNILNCSKYGDEESIKKGKSKDNRNTLKCELIYRILIVCSFFNYSKTFSYLESISNNELITKIIQISTSNNPLTGVDKATCKIKKTTKIILLVSMAASTIIGTTSAAAVATTIAAGKAAVNSGADLVAGIRNSQGRSWIEQKTLAINNLQKFKNQLIPFLDKTGMDKESKSQIASVINDITNVVNKVDNLNSKYNDLDARFNNIDQKYNQFDVKISEIEQAIDLLKYED